MKYKLTREHISHLIDALGADNVILHWGKGTYNGDVGCLALMFPRDSWQYASARAINVLYRAGVSALVDMLMDETHGRHMVEYRCIMYFPTIAFPGE